MSLCIIGVLHASWPGHGVDLNADLYVKRATSHNPQLSNLFMQYQHQMVCETSWLRRQDNLLQEGHNIYTCRQSTTNMIAGDAVRGFTAVCADSSEYMPCNAQALQTTLASEWKTEEEVCSSTNAFLRSLTHGIKILSTANNTGKLQTIGSTWHAITSLCWPWFALTLPRKAKGNILHVSQLRQHCRL